MTSIGETLRRERLRRHLDIAMIAGELRISARFLEAIEADDFPKLPGGVFTKSFVRQYAVFLGLNADDLTGQLQQATQPEPAVEQAAERAKPDVPGLQIQSAADRWRSIGEGRTGLPPWFRAGALLVLLMVACSGVYWWWDRTRHPVLAVEAPPARVIPQPKPAVPPSAPPMTEPLPNTAATSVPAAIPAPGSQTAAQPVSNAAPVTAVATTPAPAPSNPNAAVRVAITADEPVWIRADVNGKYQFSGVLQAHESRNFDGDGEVRIRLGNAGGATMTLNGKAIGAVGPKGQVRTVQFTSGGFQIVSPAISFDPLERL